MICKSCGKPIIEPYSLGLCLECGMEEERQEAIGAMWVVAIVAVVALGSAIFGIIQLVRHWN